MTTMTTTQNNTQSEPKMARLYTAPCQCFINSYLNQNGIYKSLDLKMVVGSVGWNDWFEYGGKGWTLLDFIKAKKGYTSWDAHCWLEDSEGNVYDFISGTDDLYTRHRTGKGLKLKGVIQGVSKADLLKKGIEYIPGDEATQYAIFKSQMAQIISDSEGIADDNTIVLTNGREFHQTMTIVSASVDEWIEKNKARHTKKGVWVERTYILHPTPVAPQTPAPVADKSSTLPAPEHNA